jgi:di/tricarboxylate transporter
LGDLGWGEQYGVSVLGIQRGERDIPAPGARRYIQPGDVLYVQGAADRLLQLARRQRLTTPTDRTRRELNLSTEGGKLVEVMVAPGSSLAGRTLREERFAQRYDATVLAVQHHGVTVHERLADIKFHVGDLLLVHGPGAALEQMGEDSAFIPMGEVKGPQEGRPRAGVAVLIMAGVVLAAGTGVIGILSAAMAGMAIMVFSGCVRLDEVYSELDWGVVFLLAGLIPLGLALDKTGAAGFLASGLVDLTGSWGPTGIIAAFYLFTAVMTAIVSNAATAVMLTPVAIIAATEAGMNPYALLVAVMFGASASFITPFGYQTNVMIYSPGGYRFSDFIRVGGVLNLILLVTAVIFIPIFWPS